MIGIQAIGSFIPDFRKDNRQNLAQFELDEIFLIEKIGMQRLAIKDELDDTSDLCVKAFINLNNKADFNIDEIECIVVCTQNPDNKGLPHTSSIVHGKLGLPDSCAAFDVSLGCSGFVYGLSIIQGFMQSNGFKKGILFTADPYSKIINPQDKNTSLLFGDAATATLISDTPIWHTGKFLMGSHGKLGESIKIDPMSQTLQMNGRAVFTFSATMVPNNITAMLEKNLLAIEDIDLFVLHQGSRYIVESIAKKLDINPEKAPFFASDYGNTVSSSIPIILSQLDSDAKKVVIAGFGVGLSWASTVLLKTN